MMPKSALVLKAAEQKYAVPAENVRQIVHLAALVSTPEQPSLLSGFLNFHGQAIPVIRLRKLLGIDACQGQIYTPLVIIETEGLMAALEADAVEEVVEIDRGSIRLLRASDSPNHCAEAVFGPAGQEIILLSCSSLLLAREKECLRELQEVMERRLLELSHPAE